MAIALQDWGYVDTDAFSATVVDLAQRGYLTIEETDRRPQVHRAPTSPGDGLMEFERMTMTRLFENGDEISQKQLTSVGQGAPDRRRRRG